MVAPLLLLLGCLGLQVSAFTDHPFFPLLKEANGASLKAKEDGHSIHKRAASASESYFDQLVDHSSSSGKTFKQRYFVNKAYSSGTKIHILYLEGPEEADPSHITNPSYAHVQNAKELNATLWSLEHRYYGKSQPFSNVATRYLNNLDTKQAVEDVADFIRGQNKASGEDKPKWILYGAFYGGSLALWTRQKYPELSAGVVSSGAPAVPAADFYAYQKNVENAFRDYNKDCYQNIYDSVKSVREQMQSDGGRKNLSTDFKLQPAFSGKVSYSDSQFFYIFLAFFFQQSVQFNKVNVGPFNSQGGIADVCKIFQSSNNTDPYGRMKSFVYYIVPVITGKSFSGLPNDYNKFVKNLRNSETSSDYLATRSWLWQRCNEVGYFYTTDYGNAYAFGSNVPNNFWINVCTNVFGSKYNVNNLQAGVKAAIKYYGDSGVTNVTNAVILQGSVDPWRSVGVSRVSDSSSSIISIKGYGQAADLRPATPNDEYSLNFTRKITLRKIKTWLNPNSKANKALKRKLVHQEAFEHEDERFRREVAELKVHNWHGEIQWDTPYPEDLKPRREKFRYQHTFSEELERRAKASNSSALKHKKAKHGYILQDMDHFNASNNPQKWKQHFYYNRESETKDGPIFLMMGGESRIGPWDVTQTFMYAIAEEFGAALYSVEHRFYGKSQPTDGDLSTENLQKYLTFEQVLADAAVFVENIKKTTNRTDSKWVVFGGSYPGMLAAWFRLKYPDLITGAVASSAPVQAQTDSFEYMQVVHNATKKWGTKTCSEDAHELFEGLHRLLTNVKGRTKLAKYFGLCQSWKDNSVDERDVQHFLRLFIGMLAGTVQYDDHMHEELEDVCNYYKKLVNFVHQIEKAKAFKKSSAKENFKLHPLVEHFHKQIPSHMFKNKKRSCLDINYEASLEELAEEEPYTSDSRSYTWQSCMQMGISESTDIGYNIFESATTTNYYTDMCYVFGKQFNREVLDAGQRRTNAVYGGQDNFTGTNVVFVNGSEDPWHPPGVYNPVGANNTVILIDGTSHCYDMYPPSPNEPSKITDAHDKIRGAIKGWLGISSSDYNYPEDDN